MPRPRKLLRIVLVVAVLLVAVPAGLLGLDHVLRPSLTAAELNARLSAADAPVVIDVRTPAEFAAGHIPGARNVPFQRMGEHADELRALGRPLVLTCAHGPRASMARLALGGSDGLEMLYLEGHMNGWIAAELPLERDADAP